MTPSMTQTWVIGGEQFTPEPIGFECSRAAMHLPFSVAFFCPYCGDVWARRIVVGGDRQWVLWNRPCAQHPHEESRGLSGSIYLPWETEYIKHLPHAVLKREFLLHFDAKQSNQVKDTAP